LLHSSAAIDIQEAGCTSLADLLGILVATLGGFFVGGQGGPPTECGSDEDCEARRAYPVGPSQYTAAFLLFAVA